MFRPELSATDGDDGDESLAVSNRIKGHFASFIVLICVLRAARYAAERAGYSL